MMGSPLSKKPSPPLDESGGGSSGSSNSNNSMEYYGGMSSYETDSQNIDSILQQRTISAISILAGSGVNSITFETLKQVTGCLLENNQEVVKIILEYKKDIWKSPELLELVEEYFENSLKTLDFLAALEKCLKKARNSQLIIRVALRRFEEEEGEESGEEDGSKKYKRTLEELQHFKAAGDPFTEEFFQVFRSVHRQQVSMLMKLKQKQKKLDKKLKSVKAWRRVSRVIFVSAFAAVLICSVVAAVMAAPPVAAALAAAAAIPLGSVGKWIDSLWNGYSNVLQGQKDVIGTMEIGTVVAISDLDSIRVLVDRLEIQIGALLHNVDFALRGEEAVKFGIEEIKKKLEEFMTGIEDLGKQVDRSTRDIQRARTVVLHRIIKHPK